MTATNINTARNRGWTAQHMRHTDDVVRAIANTKFVTSTPQGTAESSTRTLPLPGTVVAKGGHARGWPETHPLANIVMCSIRILHPPNAPAGGTPSDDGHPRSILGRWDLVSLRC